MCNTSSSITGCEHSLAAFSNNNTDEMGRFSYETKMGELNAKGDFVVLIVSANTLGTGRGFTSVFIFLFWGLRSSDIKLKVKSALF